MRGSPDAGMRRRRGLVIAAVAMGGALLLAVLAARSAGGWLVVDEALEPSRAVVVLSGGLPFRAMEAAAVYKEGWAPELWLTAGRPRADDAVLARLGIDRPPEHHYTRRVLERLGVPPAAIRVLHPPATNTAEEMDVTAQHLRAVGGGAVIVVTSRYHTRRVRFLWRRIAGPGAEARVRYARGEPWVPERWWTTSTDIMAVAREWVGLANALANFPIQTVED